MQLQAAAAARPTALPRRARPRRVAMASSVSASQPPADARACFPMAGAPSGAFLDVVPYTPPPWALGVTNPPATRVVLAHTPTPLHAWRPPGVPADVTLLLKRDDMTGAELSGNKVRQAMTDVVSTLESHAWGSLAWVSLYSAGSQA